MRFFTSTFRKNLRHSGFSTWDILGVALITLICYISFAHTDLYVTGNRAWLYYFNNFFDFYEASYEWAGNYGANYMPSTFWLYAIWNLPLRLFVEWSADMEANDFLRNMWYKLLPTVFYFASTFLLYKIARRIGLKEKGSTLCAILFFTNPIGFYSQFIFSQYDIFTVFFVLLGIWYFAKDDPIKFALIFGLAATFKYYALLFFFPLLLLKEKHVPKILGLSALSVLPLAFETALYIGSPSFHAGVFGFRLLGNATAANFGTYIGSISYMQVLCLFLIAWAYFIHPKNEAELWRWYLFLACGICFALFGLMTWNPQWLLMAVPFWTLSVCIHKNKEIFLWLDCLQALLFYIVVSRSWTCAADERLLSTGIWQNLFPVTEFTFHIYSLFPVESFITTIISAFFVILLVRFVFVHPRYTEIAVEEETAVPSVWLFRFRFACGPVLFILLCALVIVANILF